MSNNIFVEITNIETGITKIQEEISFMKELHSRVSTLTFANSRVSSGKCSRAMASMTTTDIKDMIDKQIALMEKTIELLEMAMEKYQFADLSLSENMK